MSQSGSCKREMDLQDSDGAVPSKRSAEDLEQVVPPKEPKSNGDDQDLAVLVVGGKKFQVSKKKLLEECGFFEPIFNGSYKEATMAEIPLHEHSADSFQLFLSLLNGENVLKADNMECALELSRFYQAQRVTKQCEEWLMGDSVMDKKYKWFLADQYDLEELKKSTLETMETLFDIQQILPEDINQWVNRSTPALVLQKTLGFFGIPRRYGMRTIDEVRAEQEVLKVQLEAMKQKMEEYKRIVEKEDEEKAADEVRQRELRAWQRERKRLE